jgi:glycosyltransferase involved in cell wall biosynthesis
VGQEREKPVLLVLATTFPRWPGDHEPPFVFELARRLTDRFEVHVVAPHAPGAATRETLSGVEVHRFRYAPERLERLAYDGGIPVRLRLQPWLAVLLPGFFLAQLALATRLTRELDADVIHAHWLLPGGLIGAIIKELLPGSRRLVITAHGADVRLAEKRGLRWLSRLAAESADAVTAVSTSLADRLRKLLPTDTPITVASMGVDLRHRFVPAGQWTDEPRLVFAGRLVPKKGADTLVAAMPAILSRHPSAHLTIVGDGPMAEQLKQDCRQLGIQDSVTFVGRVSNDRLPGCFHQARLAVLPFRTPASGDLEGLGLVTVEAIGCGLPVIVGDVPAIHDVVTHGQTGWLVNPDSAEALAQAVIHLLEHPEVAERLRDSARPALVARFDWSVVAANYVRILGNARH